jgi:hypothetical protein
MTETLISAVHFFTIHALTGLLVLGAGAGFSWATARVFMKGR